MKLKKISLFTIILVFILSFITYSMEKTEVFNIDNEWSITFSEKETEKMLEYFYSIEKVN
ncbi:hypothetical protein [Fusobacterium vincentii]|uniref:hypothetical protein n=1 Tax=Fusobacterium vincentii TaxID=155615 RepID=UPI002B28F15F|nr:hypothetical protein FVTDC_10580 [Fusobacterium vincentii]